MKQFKIGDTVRDFMALSTNETEDYVVTKNMLDVCNEFQKRLELVSHADGTPLTLVEKARLFSRTRHHGQFRRDGITPYFVHPEKVASLVESDFEKAVAFCHDLIENKRAIYEELTYELEMGVDLCVDVLTRRENESYERYILRIVAFAKQAHKDYRETVIRVKIADIVANLSDSPTEKQVVKYFNALKILAGV
jgi:(p)ppGpp synthase/HD superfamily hydrolase